MNSRILKIEARIDELFSKYDDLWKAITAKNTEIKQLKEQIAKMEEANAKRRRNTKHSSSGKSGSSRV